MTLRDCVPCSMPPARSWPNSLPLGPYEQRERASNACRVAFCFPGVTVNNARRVKWTSATGRDGFASLIDRYTGTDFFSRCGAPRLVESLVRRLADSIEPDTTDVRIFNPEHSPSP